MKKKIEELRENIEKSFDSDDLFGGDVISILNDGYNCGIEEGEDKYKRLLADFENFKKNKLKEIEHIRKFANINIIKDILPIIDDIDRMVEYEDLTEGAKIIYNQITTLIKNCGVVSYGNIGDKFDESIYHAITTSHNGEEKGTITNIIKKGYKMDDEIIRYAQVIVEE